MRVLGTVTRWFDDRGFGFITPAKGGGDLFVHISAFPRDVVRPGLNELVSFEVESGPDGKQRAVRVARPGQKPPARAAWSEPYRSRRRPRSSALALLAVAGLAMVGYSWFQWGRSGSRSLSLDLPAEPDSQPAFSCDGRTRCSQMTSCEEAMFFLHNCPGTQMDGDGDGEPCESQWC